MVCCRIAFSETCLFSWLVFVTVYNYIKSHFLLLSLHPESYFCYCLQLHQESCFCYCLKIDQESCFVTIYNYTKSHVFVIKTKSHVSVTSHILIFYCGVDQNYVSILYCLYADQ